MPRAQQKPPGKIRRFFAAPWSPALGAPKERNRIRTPTRLLCFCFFFLLLALLVRKEPSSPTHHSFFLQYDCVRGSHRGQRRNMLFKCLSSITISLQFKELVALYCSLLKITLM
ncbi:unnamed protein product [Ixodes pacificus]